MRSRAVALVRVGESLAFFGEISTSEWRVAVQCECSSAGSLVAMRCREENCEVDLLLEHHSLIVLAVDKTILCICGGDAHNPFERGKLRKREEHSASVHPAEVMQAPAPPPEPLAARQQPLWQFPPPLPPPCIYTHDQDNLMQPIGNERASFRNLRKNLGGRWKKLTQKKPEQEVYSIPPEFKPQLKQIYVY